MPLPHRSRKSADSWWTLPFFFHGVGSRDPTQLSGLAATIVYLPSHLVHSPTSASNSESRIQIASWCPPGELLCVVSFSFSDVCHRGCCVSSSPCVVTGTERQD